jgi:hypothetical protein
MLEYRPRRLLGVATGVVGIIAVLILDVLLFILIRSAPINLLTFLAGLLVVLSIPLMAVGAYLVYGLVSLHYLMGRDSLVISWSRRRETIPLAAIESAERVVDTKGRIVRRGIRYPGHCLGWGRDERGRRLLLYSTGRPAEELLIATQNGSYVISPSNPSGFLSALAARRRVGPTQSVEHVRVETGLAGLPIWRDWIALGLAGAGAVANALLFAYVSLQYPRLPGIVPLLSEAGQVKLIGSKAELFELPAIGLTVLVTNTILGFGLHRWERPATYALGAFALLVQVLFWVAVIGLVG